MKKHTVRAPQTDRYLIEVPCSAAELTCSPFVFVTGTDSVETGIAKNIRSTATVEDTKTLVTSTTPFEITAKEAGLYLVVATVQWTFGAYADVSYLIGYTLNGALGSGLGYNLRAGSPVVGHTQQSTFFVRLAVGQRLGIQVTSLSGNYSIVTAVQVTQAGP